MKRYVYFNEVPMYLGKSYKKAEMIRTLVHASVTVSKGSGSLRYFLGLPGPQGEITEVFKRGKLQ
jgi:hypothetical protein